MGTNIFIMLKKTHFDFFLGFMHVFLYRNMFRVVDSFWVFLSKFIIYVFGSIIGYFFRFPANRYLEEIDYGACLDSNFDELEERQSTDHVDQGNKENSSLVASTSKYEFLYRKVISGFIEEPKAGSFTLHEFYMGSNDYDDCNSRILDSRDSANADIGKIEVEVEDMIEEKLEDPVKSFTVEKAENSIESFMVEKILEKEPQLKETIAVFENKIEESALRFFFATGFEKPIKQDQSVEAKVIFEERTDNFDGEKAEDSVGSSIVENTLEEPEQAIETEDVVKDKAKDSVENFIVEKLLEKPKQEIENDDIFGEKSEDSVENYITEKILEKHVRNIEGNDHIEEKFWDFFDGPVIDKYLEKCQQEKEESNEDGEMFSPRSKVDVKSITYGVLANRLDLTPETHVLTDGQKVENMEHEIHECNTSFSDQEAAIIRGPINDSDDEFIELEPWSGKLCVMGETQSGEDLSIEDKDDEEDFNYKETESMVSPEKTKEPTLQECISNYEEQEDDSEFGSEHDDLIERLKMELKIARTGGLPTILEESESPEMVQELETLKIDEKYDHKDHIAEIQKVYKSYSDKMRKLDILNSQIMHAISLLQLKDPVRLSTSGKSSAPAIKSLLSHKVWSFKQRTPEADPAMKLIRDLHKDFETIYVGQVCLSWEILHWQFGKVKKLLDCDSHGIRQYNQLAGEFQHFQVLVQRFLEDEPFQARPRVENYVKNRCALRHLLQVPVIKDDCSKYKNGIGDQEDAVSSEMLTDIIEEPMHVFWEFLRADQDEANATSKTPQQAQVAPHDTIDLELLMDVRTDLQKKEKRLKEIQRSTNCIIKKFQRQHQGNLLDHELFVAQVELKLVSRVLNMSKITTDQLVWCHEKLQKLNFSSRKIEIEPSFTLFPC
ncbi:hypothetical protein CRYUN_Cryun21dG0011000 [Craigia yunnanensis]